MANARMVCPVAATLGEGPVWCERRNVLWFVDIKAPAVHCFDPATSGLASWPAPAPVGWLALTESEVLLAGMKTGLSRFDPATGAFTRIADVEPDLPGNRLNDATVGPDGILWFGSMDDAEMAPTGRYYRYDGTHIRACAFDPVTITNGPALSPDGRTFYAVDTLGRRILACPVAEDGALGAPEPFVAIAEADGYPDGPTVDAEGCVWIGLWAGWQARRYSPDGELLASIKFPAANITKVAFGGPDLKTLYATSARKGLSLEDLAAQPLAGNLFAATLDVAGRPAGRVRA